MGRLLSLVASTKLTQSICNSTAYFVTNFSPFSFRWRQDKEAWFLFLPLSEQTKPLLLVIFIMDLCPDQLAASAPPAVIGGVALFFVSVLTLCSVRPVYRRSYRSEILYRDQDGSATAESEKKALTAGRNASGCALLVSSVGLAASANGGLKGLPRLRESGFGREALDFILLVGSILLLSFKSCLTTC